MTGYNLPPGVSERDIPNWDDREEEAIEVEAKCHACGWTGLAEIFEGEFTYPCPSCDAEGDDVELVRA